MQNETDIILFHAPNSRSSGVLALLEELQAPHEIRLLNLKAGDQRQPAYLGVNPMGKVPAILHDGVLITEQVAVYLYLADLFPRAGLAPSIGDRRRGSYLRWMAFYSGCFEPAIIDKAMQRDPGPAMMSPYGDFQTVMATVNAQLAPGPFILGDDFTAADVLWGSALGWMTKFGVVQATPEIADYVERTANRPAALRVRVRDAALAAQQKTS